MHGKQFVLVAHSNGSQPRHLIERASIAEFDVDRISVLIDTHTRPAVRRVAKTPGHTRIPIEQTEDLKTKRRAELIEIDDDVDELGTYTAVASENPKIRALKIQLDHR